MSFTSPSEGEGRYGPEVTITYDVERFTLDAEAMDGPDEEGVGHVHVYLDDVLVGESAEETYTYLAMTKGEHLLEVRLATNSHAEVGMGSQVNIPVLVPTIAIGSPADGTALTLSNTLLTASIADFSVTPDTAFGAPAFGQGRILVRVDGVPVDLAVDPAAIPVSPLTEGEHTITLALATADGQAITPAVEDSILVTVPAAAPTISLDRTGYDVAWDSATVPLALSAVNGALTYQLYVDGEYVQEGEAGATALLHMTPGYHYVEAHLMDTDAPGVVSDHVHLFVTADRPDVRVLSPGDQWGVAADFDVTAEAENITLDPNIGGANVDGHGHWSIEVDGQPAAETATGTASLTGLLPGDHTLRIELRNNDRTPLDPPVYDEITVTVE